MTCFLAVLCLTLIVFNDSKSRCLAGSYADFEDDDEVDTPEPTPYVSPMAKGAYLAEHFDDIWTFEREWIMSGASTSLENQRERWRLVPAPDSVWESDLGLTLAPGSRHLSLSRPLDGPLTGRPLIVQFQLLLPRLRQCAGVQLRFLTDSAADRLDLVNSSTPHSLLFAAESCADQLKLQLGGPGLGRRPLSVDVPPRLAPGQRLHVYRLVAAGRSVQLRLDGQIVKNISLASLLEPAGTSESDGQLQHDHTRSGSAGMESLLAARALNVQLWSAGDGLRLDNLIVTAQTAEADRFVPPPPPPPEPRAEHLRQRSTAESLEWLDWYLDYSAERPWVYALLVLAVGVPACLLLSCCLPESLDLEAQRRKAEALKKKTDEDPDDHQRNSSGHDRLKVAGHRSTQSPIPGQPRRRTLQKD
ncbi:uncharacterized protein LOC122382253 [Amphibalanus amphitrite]|uniref:uncharacterized protein LOC122382253 n=1 Tax=Amphibalanus amphitrite TaxID=1232801 RepID=UPI001C8FC0B5|nr:uncharacterized protein LOC122382253 [Amphibalanus amphitrite]